MNQGAYLVDRNFVDPQTIGDLHAEIQEKDWVPTHPDGPYQSDAWRVIKLISKKQKTAEGGKFAKLWPIIDRFKCPIDDMVYYSILPGGILHPHRDVGSTLELNRLRFHIPIKTNPGVDFRVSKKTVPMKPGELWALNTSYLHSVSNLGDADRIHLVLMVEVNDWVWSLLPKKNHRYYAHAAGFFSLIGWTAVKTVLFDREKLKGRIKLAAGTWRLAKAKFGRK